MTRSMETSDKDHEKGMLILPGIHNVRSSVAVSAPSATLSQRASIRHTRASGSPRHFKCFFAIAW